MMPSKKELSILMVEDVTADAVLINHELRRGGLSFRAKRVETREQFLHELQSHPPDIILSDHGLPHFDGFTALAIAKDKCPDVPFIFVTGSLGEEVAIETFKSGATDYVLKNRLSTNLVSAVRQALHGSEERQQRRQAEQALRESEERFRMLVEGVRDYAILLLNSKGRVTSCNSGAEMIHGHRTSEIIGQQFADFYTKEDAGLGQPARDLEAATHEGHTEIEGWRVRKGGGQFWANVVITALRSEKGQLRGFIQVTRDVTERRRARKALEESEARKSAILETALDAIISIDHEGKVREWNPAAARMFGYTSAQILGQNMAEKIVPASLRAAHSKGFAQCVATGKGRILGQRMEMTGQRADGSEFPVELALTRVPTEGPPTFTGFIRDITERKKADAALRESEARKGAILETALDAIISMDEQGIIHEWNPAAERIFGYPRAEALNRSMDELIVPPSVRDVYHDRLSNYLITGVGSLLGRPIEMPAMRADKSEFSAELAITRVAGREPSIYTCFIRDITARKRAEEELSQSEERYRMLVEGVSDYAIYMLDPEGCVATWNAGAERIEGYKADEIMGQHIARFFPSEDVQQGKPDLMLKAAKRDGRCTDEGWRMRKDGTRYWSNMVLTALYDHFGKHCGFSKISHDVTQRKQAEEEIHQLNTELEQRVIDRTSQLQAAYQEMESFSYSISHDLRAPLRHIQGFVEVLQSKLTGSLDEENAQLLKTIADAGKHMGRLIDDLLNFSRMGRVEMQKQPVSLAELVKAVRNDLQPETRGRKIKWVIGELPEVWADASLLRQVLTNLLSNSLKYTRTRDEAQIEMASLVTDTEVTVHIRDNGVGFDMQYVEKLFGVFQRLHRAADFEGTGIGLANVQRIIHRHGGRVWAEGAVNSGAVFHFSLPKSNGGHL
jgi:PAS domain S-box-containing protein